MTRRRGFIPRTWATIMAEMSWMGRRNLRPAKRKVKSRRPSPAIKGILRICPGGRHAWFNSEVGPIRKPVSEAVEAPIRERLQKFAGKEITPELEEQIIEAITPVTEALEVKPDIKVEPVGTDALRATVQMPTAPTGGTGP